MVERFGQNTTEGPPRFKFRGTIPSGFKLVSEPKWSLVGGGVGALAGGYLVSAAAGLLGGHAEGLIPIVGTVVLAAEGWSSISYGGWGSSFFEGFVKVMVVTGCLIDVAAQVAGVVMMVVGVNSPHRWLERATDQPTLSFVPGAAGAPLGASVVGRF